MTGEVTDSTIHKADNIFVTLGFMTTNLPGYCQLSRLSIPDIH